jgi:hypothetical protein
MKFLCLVYYEEAKLEALSKEDFDVLVHDSLAYDEELRKGGHYVESAALQSARSATTLHRRDGKVAATDGPFAETKEQLGGFILIEARDKEEAVRLASKIPPGRLGSIEVRPVMDLD